MRSTNVSAAHMAVLRVSRKAYFYFVGSLATPCLFPNKESCQQEVPSLSSPSRGKPANAALGPLLPPASLLESCG